MCINVIQHMLIVEDKMESLDNPLHECAKRGNLEFLKVQLKVNKSDNNRVIRNIRLFICVM